MGAPVAPICTVHGTSAPPSCVVPAYYPLVGLCPLERAFAHILTGHAMRALRSTRIISASAHPVSMQERVKSFPSVSGKASGSAGCPRTERGKLTVFGSRCANSFRGPGPVMTQGQAVGCVVTLWCRQRMPLAAFAVAVLAKLLL